MKKDSVRVVINFSSRAMYTLIALTLILITGVGVYAFGTSSPSSFGHSIGEIDGLDTLVPTGAVMYFNLGFCPSGWSELTNARGRYIVGSHGNAGVGSLIGDDLNNGENRPVGGHSHGVNDPRHSHNIVTNPTAPSGSSIRYVRGVPSSSWPKTNLGTHSSATGITIQSTGIGGTNAPYIQLLVCQKN